MRIAVVTLLVFILFTATTVAQEPPSCEFEYTVQAGDWLSRVAEKYYGDPLAYDRLVVAANTSEDDAFSNIDNPNLIELQPGEIKTVSIPLDFRAFAYYHPGYQQWVTETGEFDIRVGSSTADIRGSQIVTLQSTLNLPSLLDHESTVREWLADRRGKLILEPLFEQIVTQMGGALGSDEGQTIGTDMVGFMMDMPLLSVLHFQESLLSVTPEDRVDQLLEQVAGLEA